MKRTVIIILGIICVTAFCFGCGLAKKPGGGNEPETKPATVVNGNGERMDFQSIRISESGSMAYSTVYYAEKTADGVRLEYYMGSYYWDGNDQKEDKQMIHQIDGDVVLYEHVAELAGKYNLASWDGFSGSDPNVLDGYGFTLEAVLADGTTIFASGSNKFPEGYRGFIGEMDALLSREVITETRFDTGDYSIELPESWLNNVTAVFREGYVAFEVQTEVQNRTILCIYNEPYEYGNGGEDYQTIKKYHKEGSDWYIVMYRYPEADSAYDEMNDAQKAICDSLNDDMQTIAESLKLK